MNRKAKAVLDAILTLVTSTLIPLMLPRMLPPDVMEAASYLPFNLTGLMNEIALIGLVMAALALSKGFVDKASPVHLGISTISKVLWLVFIFIVMGLGRIGNLGVTKLTMEMEGAVITVVLDFQVFVYLTILTVLLKITYSFLEFRDARLEKM